MHAISLDHWIPFVVEVRAGERVQTFLRPVSMLAWFYGKENCASKEKTRSSRNGQRHASCCPHAAVAVSGPRSLGNSAV
jgi:tRNA G26 N,N-dimethylase Trm1